MNKKVLILSTLGVLTSLVLVHGATISAPTMRMGAKGKDVVLLQEFLIDKGYLSLPQGATKGTFGALTRDAVKKFQKENGIEQTGNFGVKTKSTYLSMVGGASVVTVPTVSKKDETAVKAPVASCLTLVDGSTSCQSDDEDSCKAKGGTYNECGSLCDTKKEGVVCPMVCVKTCTVPVVKSQGDTNASTTSVLPVTTDTTGAVTNASMSTSTTDNYTPAVISTNQTDMCDDRPEGGSCKYLSEKGITSGTCVAVKESLVCQ